MNDQVRAEVQMKIVIKLLKNETERKTMFAQA